MLLNSDMIMILSSDLTACRVQTIAWRQGGAFGAAYIAPYSSVHSVFLYITVIYIEYELLLSCCLFSHSQSYQHQRENFHLF